MVRVVTEANGDVKRQKRLRAPGSGRSQSPKPEAQSPDGEANGSAIEQEIGDEFAESTAPVRYRPVTIVDAGAKKNLKLRIEVPVEDMARLTTADESPP